MKNKLGPLSCLLPVLGLVLGIGILMLTAAVKPGEPGWINSHKVDLELGSILVFAGAVALGGLLGLLGLFIGDRKVWAGLGLVLNLACVAAIMWLAGGLAVGLAHM